MKKKELKKKDINRLRELYLKLKEIMAELYEIECRHKEAKHFRETMEKTLMELNHVDHLVIQEAYNLKNEEKDSDEEVKKTDKE